MTLIALAQTTSTDDFEANLKSARVMVANAAAAGARIIAFPEVFLYIGPREGKLKHAQSLEGPVVTEFRELARAHGLMILLGSIHERISANPDRVHNTSVLIDAQGQILAHYRKLMLFDLELPDLKIQESATIVAGDQPPPVVDTEIGKVGLTICFDLRFSPLYWDLRQRGAEIVFVPSNFTAPTGDAHWEVLLRARAIESQVYVAAPAQSGRHNPSYRSFGFSMLVDPWGEVVAQRRVEPGIVVGRIDLERVRRVREELPMSPWSLRPGAREPKVPGTPPNVPDAVT